MAYAYPCFCVDDEFRAKILRWKAAAYRERENDKRAALAVDESHIASHGAAVPPSPPAEEHGELIHDGLTSGGLGHIASSMSDGYLAMDLNCASRRCRAVSLPSW